MVKNLVRHCLVGGLVVCFGGVSFVPDAFSIEAPRLVAEFIGNWGSEELGTSISNVGDVDQDGFDDLVIGAPGARYVDLVSGFDGTLIYHIERPLPLFGATVSGAGDLDADGFNDFLVSSATNGPQDTLHAFSGKTGEEIYSFWAGDLPLSSGELLIETMGSEIAPMGYLKNKDGSGPDEYADFAVHIVFRETATYQRSGKVVFFSGKPYAPPALHPEILFEARGNDEQMYGLSLAPAGDVNLDSIPDLVIGAPYYSNSERGQVYVVSGQPSQVSGLAVNLCITTSFQKGDLFGYHVGNVGDINSDQVDDYVVSSPNSTDGITDPSQASVWDRSGAIHSYRGGVCHGVGGASKFQDIYAEVDYGPTFKGSRFGEEVMSLKPNTEQPDLDFDGFPDLLAYAPRVDAYYMDDPSDPTSIVTVDRAGAFVNLLSYPVSGIVLDFFIDTIFTQQSLFIDYLPEFIPMANERHGSQLEYLGKFSSGGFQREVVAVSTPWDHEAVSSMRGGSTVILQFAPPLAPVPKMAASRTSLSISDVENLGRQRVSFLLDFGDALAGENYIVLGTTSGTSPGQSVGFGLNLPLNYDPFFWTTLVHAAEGLDPTQPEAFENAVGKLDQKGRAVVRLNFRNPLSSTLASTHMDYATIVFDDAGQTLDVSSAVGVDLTP